MVDASIDVEAGQAGTRNTGGTNSGGSGGIVDAGVADKTDLVDKVTVCQGSVSETITVPDCGTPGETTVNAYSGIVTLTIRGIVGNTANFDDADPFYFVVQHVDSVAVRSCDGCVRYNRVSEGTCLCDTCPSTSHILSGLLIDGYPGFSPTNEYTVRVDFGSGPAERLNFGYSDCGCFDNTGSYTMTLVSEGSCDR
jgi:hypothetical protein